MRYEHNASVERMRVARDEAISRFRAERDQVNMDRAHLADERKRQHDQTRDTKAFGIGKNIFEAGKIESETMARVALQKDVLHDTVPPLSELFRFVKTIKVDRTVAPRESAKGLQYWPIIHAQSKVEWKKFLLDHKLVLCHTLYQIGIAMEL